MLQNQILIIENTIDKNKLNKYIYDEKIKKFIFIHEGNKIIYNDPNKIYPMLNSLEGDFKLEIESIDSKVKYNASEIIIKFENGMFILRRIINNNKITITFYVDELIYDLKDEYLALSIKDNKVQMEGKTKFNPNEIAFEDSNFYLTSEYRIKIKPNY